MESPVCVDSCPTRALELIDLDQYEKFTGRKRVETVTDLPKDKGLDGGLLLNLVPYS